MGAMSEAATSAALFDEVVALRADLAKARTDLERVTAERDAARATTRKLHRRTQAAEGPMQSQVGLLKSLMECRFRSFLRQCRRAQAAEAEATRLRALLVERDEALRWIADRMPATCDMSLAHDMAGYALAALDKAPTPKEPA